MHRTMATLGLALCCTGAGACPGDLTGDGSVTQPDLSILLTALDTVPGDPDWNPDADFDRDGDVDQSDLGTLLAVFSTACPTVPASMILIPAGAFQMGDHHNVGYPPEFPVHGVYVSRFHMDVYETTNAQYVAALNWALGQGLIQVTGGVVYKAGGAEPYCDTTASHAQSRIAYGGGTFSVSPPAKADHPAALVTWYGAAAYANWRSEQEGRALSYDTSTWVCDFAANGYRLPTEAEWEKAARGGEYAPYYKFPWGDTLDGSKANYVLSYDPYELTGDPRTTPVGYYDGNQSPPGVDMANGYGLYDMSGNVWEWCNDWYSDTYYSVSPDDNPIGPASGTKRACRSGAWSIPNYSASCLRCSNRNGMSPDWGYQGDYGVRLVLD